MWSILAVCVGLTALLQPSAAQIACSPQLIAVGSPAEVQVSVPKSVTSVDVVVAGTTYTASSTGTPGLLQLTLPSSVTASAGPVAATVSSPLISTCALTAYDVPLVSQINPSTLTTAGFTPITLTLDATGPSIPAPTARLHVMCNADATPPPSTLLNSEMNARHAYHYDTAGTISDDFSTLTFVSRAMPPTCGYADIFVTYNEGWTWHWVGSSTPVTVFPLINITSLYPSSLDIRWVQSHNRARIAMSAEYISAVSAYNYYENAWLPEPLPDGSDLATKFFHKAIDEDKANMILCAGAEFRASSVPIAQQYPNVNILVMSTLRNRLQALPNLATATGRMREALFYCGFVSAALSSTGKLGFLLSLDHPSSYTFASAFALGARAAAAAGLTAVSNPTALTYIIGDFNLPREEVTATEDLLARGADVIMTTTDNAILVQAAAHKAGAYSCGFNADDRQTLGDRVLISALYEWVPIYITHVKRVITGAQFGDTFTDAGLGFGVSLTSFSPYVPLTVQRIVRDLVAASSVEDDLEEVLCGDLRDADGLQRLDGSTGQSATGMQPGVRGFRGTYCLNNADINTMNWFAEGVDFLGTWVPPPLPEIPVWSPSSIAAGISVLPVAAIILALAASTLVLLFRKNTIIRYSSPIFLLILNAGACLYGVSLLLLPNAAMTASSCNLRVWLYAVGFSLLFGSLFAKTHRVHRLFSNTKLLRLRLTNWWVMQLVLAILLCEIVLLLIVQFVFPQVVSSVRLIASDGSISTFERCAPGGDFANLVDGSTIVSAAHFALLLWGAYLAFRTRHVMDGFNESRYIGFSIYNVIACELIAFVLASTVNADPRSQYWMALMRVGVPPVSSLLVLYVPKLYAIWRGIVSSDSLPSSDIAASGSSKVAPAPAAVSSEVHATEANNTVV